MNLMKLLVAIALLALPSLPSCSGDHANRLPESLERVVEGVTRELTATGYEVERGYWLVFETDRCASTIATFGNCLGNNPTAPYILPIVPQWPDEFVDTTMSLAFGPVEDGHSGTYRLDDREAILVLAALPPSGTYFGLQSYVFTREGTIDEEDAVYASIGGETRDLLFATAPDPSRLLVFSSVGNSINDLVIEDRSQSAFGGGPRRRRSA